MYELAACAEALEPPCHLTFLLIYRFGVGPRWNKTGGGSERWLNACLQCVWCTYTYMYTICSVHKELHIHVYIVLVYIVCIVYVCTVITTIRAYRTSYCIYVLTYTSFTNMHAFCSLALFVLNLLCYRSACDLSKAKLLYTLFGKKNIQTHAPKQTETEPCRIYRSRALVINLLFVRTINVAEQANRML